MMPFTVQVHNAFVDGIHIGKLADKLKKYLNEVWINQ
jgi:chloramphenicol O-acetyltransferase